MCDTSLYDLNFTVRDENAFLSDFSSKLEVIDFEKEYKNYIPFISKKHRIFSCVCGNKGVFESYYNNTRFVCSTCGNTDFILTSSKRRIKIDLSQLRRILNTLTGLKTEILENKKHLCLPIMGLDTVEALVDKHTDDFYMFKLKEFLLFIDDDLTTTLKTKDKYYKVGVKDYNIYDLKGNQKSQILNFNELLATYKYLEKSIVENLKYDLLNYNGNVAVYSQVDFVDRLKLLSSNAVYQVYNNNIERYAKTHYNIGNKWNLDATNLVEILGLPKTLIKLLFELNERGRKDGATHLFSLEQTLKWVYTLHEKHSTKKIKFNTGEVINILNACVTITDKWEVLACRESKNMTNNTLDNGVNYPVAPNNLYNNYTYIEGFSLSYYDMDTLIGRFSNLVSYGYNIPRLIDYVVSCYEKQGITLSAFMVQLEDYARMSKSMELRYEKYPVSVKLAHDLTLKKYKLVKNTLKDAEIKDIAERNSKYAITVGDYLFKLPESCLEFVTESNVLRHCVSSYTDRVFDGDCIIVFMREATNPTKPFVTIEVSPNGGITQVKGFSDKKPSMECMAIVKKWANMVKLTYLAW